MGSETSTAALTSVVALAPPCLNSLSFAPQLSMGLEPLIVHVCEFSIASVVSDSANLWTLAHHAPLSMEFSRKEYWSGLPFPPCRNLLDPEVEPASSTSPALVCGFFITSAIWEAHAQAQSLPDLAHGYLRLCGYFSDVSFSHWIPRCKRRETMSARTHHHVPRANQKHKPNNDLFNYYLREENSLIIIINVVLILHPHNSMR